MDFKEVFYLRLSVVRIGFSGLRLASQAHIGPQLRGENEVHLTIS